MDKIVCKWKSDDRYMVNPDGQVYRCCFLKENYDRPSDDYFSTDTHPWVVDYRENKELYNLDNYTIDEILNSELFSVRLPNTLKDPKKAPLPCQRHCIINGEIE